MNRRDLRVLCDDDLYETTTRPVSDAELAGMGLVALDHVDVEALRRVVSLAESGDGAALGPLRRLGYLVLAAFDQDHTP